jgi:hypothetical protein
MTIIRYLGTCGNSGMPVESRVETGDSGVGAQNLES